MSYIKKMFISNYFSRCRARLKLNAIKDEKCFLLADHNHDGFVFENPGTDVTKRVQIGETNRGGKYVFLDGEKFVKCGNSKTATHYRCTKYKTKCRSRITFISGVACSGGTKHNHQL